MIALAKTAARTAPVDSPFAVDVLEGLTSTPKRLPPKYFYDNIGSRLFERIAALPEYYPTRTELQILRANAPSIAALLPAGCALVEFGSGASTKVRILIDAARHVAVYVPVDISAEYLLESATELRQAYPDIAVLPLAVDFVTPFELPSSIAALPHAGFFPGSTIGNLEPHEAATFLRNVGNSLGRDAMFIIGVDLVKDSKVLHDAYNDAQGVTAQFNLNLLARINRELGATFNLDQFEHHAFYNRERNRIEMHLASTKRQKVKVCGECIEFRAGETIHTENSYKYTVESFGALARGAGWKPITAWTDPRNYFSVHALVYKPEAQQRPGQVE
jgi:dimethylhistidine N-methyltransferase